MSSKCTQRLFIVRSFSNETVLVAIPFAIRKMTKYKGAAKGGRQKEFDHSFSFSGLFQSLFGHLF